MKSAKPVTAAVAFGSNLGDRMGHIDEALRRLAREPGVKVRARSRVLETAAEGGPPQGPFLNGVALIETTLGARALLERMLAVEQACGRVRRERNGPRTIDLDLIFYDDEAVAEAGLELPHPRAHLRRFVLEPLAELAPDWRHPRFARTVRELLSDWEREHPASRGDPTP